ncbi:succinate dehydrogenase, cytochrome b556 subunit [Flocculibacter collagenilyticus]|uniref:succinate dehydrogenase, cytochrome b556 subunit n=1 Tax=Flocculibacter collagenilyticus TaxID=2744479 RepID=UPI0018F336E3|nr:succinate dehydrogenase, cytochrome b556 subunit [Flocculibacter collagenilyticus]
MKKQRPVNLDLTTIDFPASAKASILHRISGVAMFFALIFVVWAWAESLSSPEGFDYVKELLTSFLAKFIAWGTLIALSYHLLGGIRHIFMDMGHFEELESGSNSAKLIFVVWVLVAIALAYWIFV